LNSFQEFLGLRLVDNIWKDFARFFCSSLLGCVYSDDLHLNPCENLLFAELVAQWLDEQELLPN